MYHGCNQINPATAVRNAEWSEWETNTAAVDPQHLKVEVAV